MRRWMLYSFGGVLALLSVYLYALPESINLTKLYGSKVIGYTINFPQNWVFDEKHERLVIFSGKPNTPAYYSTVNVQKVPSVKKGGVYSKVSDVTNNLVSQLSGLANANAQITDRKRYVHQSLSARKMVGEQFVVTYHYNGQKFKQWQIVLPSVKGDTFYTWAYTSHADKYTKSYPIAEAMLRSWDISQ